MIGKIDWQVVIFFLILFLVFLCGIAFHGCSASTAQTSSHVAQAFNAAIADIPIKAPKPAESSAAIESKDSAQSSDSVNAWLVPMLVAVLVNQHCSVFGDDKAPLINQECLLTTYQCLGKLPIEKRVNPGNIGQCAEQFHKEVKP